MSFPRLTALVCGPVYQRIPLRSLAWPGMRVHTKRKEGHRKGESFLLPLLQLAPPPSLPHIDSGLTQNPLDGLISLNSLRASTTSRPSHLAASGPAPCKAPTTQLHRSSPWPSEILSKEKVREAKDRTTPKPRRPEACWRWRLTGMET